MLYELKYYHSLYPVEILHFIQHLLLSESARLLLLTLHSIFYANGFQITTNTRLLRFSAAQTTLSFQLTQGIMAPLLLTNAASHASAVHLESISCGLTVEIEEQETSKGVPTVTDKEHFQKSQKILNSSQEASANYLSTDSLQSSRVTQF